MKAMHDMAGDKEKFYTCVVWTSRDITTAELAGLEAIKDLQVRELGMPGKKRLPPFCSRLVDNFWTVAANHRSSSGLLYESCTDGLFKCGLR